MYLMCLYLYTDFIFLALFLILQIINIQTASDDQEKKLEAVALGLPGTLNCL